MFARKFSNIDFFLKILLLKADELVMSEKQKNWGVTDFVLEKACSKEHLNRPCSIYQYSSMAPRLSGQTSIFGVAFFVSKSLLGIERQKKL